MSPQDWSPQSCQCSLWKVGFHGVFLHTGIMSLNGIHDSGPSSNLSFPALSASPCRRPGRLYRHSHKLETADLWVKPFLSVSWHSQVILLQWRRADATWGSQRHAYFIFVMHCFCQPLLPFPCNPTWNIGASWLTHRRKEKTKNKKQKTRP